MPRPFMARARIPAPLATAAFILAIVALYTALAHAAASTLSYTTCADEASDGPPFNNAVTTIAAITNAPPYANTGRGTAEARAGNGCEEPGSSSFHYVVRNQFIKYEGLVSVDAGRKVIRSYSFNPGSMYVGAYGKICGISATAVAWWSGYCSTCNTPHR